VTDDCSTDGTADAIAAIGDPRIRLERNPRNLGPSVTANRNVARARGRFLCFLPSDDVFLPGKFARQLAAFDATPALGAAFSWMAPMDERGQLLEQVDAYFRPVGVTRESALRHFLFAGNLLSAPTAMIRRDLLARLGPFEPCLWQTQDYDLWVRLCIAAPIAMLEEPLVAYRMRDHGANMHHQSPATIARLAWELPRVLRRFLDFPDGALFLRAFPEAAPHLARGLRQNEALALVALASPAPAARTFGIEALHAALLDPDSAGRLEADGHGYRFFFHALAEVDPMQTWATGLSGTLAEHREAYPSVRRLQEALETARHDHAALVAYHEEVITARDWWRRQAETWEAAARR